MKVHFANMYLDASVTIRKCLIVLALTTIATTVPEPAGNWSFNATATRELNYSDFTLESESPPKVAAETSDSWTPLPHRKPLVVESDEKSLLDYFSEIDPSVRPVKNNRDAVTVEVGLTLIQIIDMNEKDQVLTANVWIDQIWKDQFAVWNESEFNGLQSFRIPCKKLWKPDLVLYNSASDYVEDKLCPRALLTSDGTVFWPLPVKVRSSCKVDVTYFPFDEQKCNLRFGSWIYDGTQVDIKLSKENITTDTYMANCEWDLLRTNASRIVQMYPCCPVPYPEVTFELHIKRRLLYYMYHVVYPCVTMSALTLLEFSLPPESGEKISLGITVLLAFSVLTLSIGEALPESSDSIPLISIYLTVIMTISSLSIVLTVIVLNIHYCSHDTPPLPACFRHFITVPDYTPLPSDESKRRFSFLRGRGRWRVRGWEQDRDATPTLSPTPTLTPKPTPMPMASEWSWWRIWRKLGVGVTNAPQTEVFAANGNASSKSATLQIDPVEKKLVTTCSFTEASLKSLEARMYSHAHSNGCGSASADAEAGKRQKRYTPKSLKAAAKDGASFLNSFPPSPIFMAPPSPLFGDSSTKGRAAVTHSGTQTDLSPPPAPTRQRTHLLPLLRTLSGDDSQSGDLLRSHLVNLFEKEAAAEEITRRHREWQLFARFVDRVLFWIFVVVTFLLTSVALVIIPIFAKYKAESRTH